MAGSTKPKRKMKYPPGCGLERNKVATAVEFAKPISEQDGWLSSTQLQNHGAMVELLAGRATREHLRSVVAAYNTTRSLLLMGFGVDHHEIVVNSADAIQAIASRYTKHGKYVLTGPEITALNALMELYDAQMEIATVGDIEKAIANARAEFYSGKCLKLPHVYIGDSVVDA